MKKPTILFVLAVALIFAFTQTSFASIEDLEPIPQASEYVEHLTIGGSGQITTLDPGLLYNTQHNRMYYMVYDLLIKNRHGKLIPSLAESWKWNDDKYTSLNVTLRSGAKFHNGEPVTAADVAFSLERNVYSMIADFYDHSEIIDDTHMNIILKEPDADFLYALTYACAGIVCKKAVEADKDRGAAIGSGPWINDVSKFVAADRVELIRNDDYWGEKPKTKRITLRYISDPSTRLIALQNNEIQIMTDVNMTERPIVESDPNVGFEVFPSTSINYFAFNNRDGVCADDLDLRRAVACAIDREEILAALDDPEGKPTNTMYGWTMSSFKNDFDLDLTYAPEKAKEYLANAKNKKFRFMATTTNMSYKTMAEVIMEQLRRVGIETELEEVDSTGLSANSRYATASHETMVYGAGLYDWECHSWTLFTKGSNSNKAVMDDPEVNELMRAARATDDAAKRLEINHKIQTIVHDKCYYVPLFYRTNNVAFRKGLGGAYISPNSVHDFSYICIPVK